MIALHNIAKSYPLPRGKKVVLDDVNITFRPGENMGILGLNGAGKSTLAKALCGFVPSQGKLTYKGQDISQDSIAERTEPIGSV